MTPRQKFIDLIEFIQEHQLVEHTLSSTLELINESYSVISYTPPLYKAFWLVMNQLFSAEQIEWIEWWLYERDQNKKEPQAWLGDHTTPIPMNTVTDLYKYLLTIDNEEEKTEQKKDRSKPLKGQMPLWEDLDTILNTKTQ